MTTKNHAVPPTHESATPLPQHSPLPWFVFDSCPAFDGQDAIFSEAIEDAVVCVMGGDIPEEPGNASYIVLACNSFPKLVASLKALLKVIPSSADMAVLVRMASGSFETGNQLIESYSQLTPAIEQAEEALREAGAL